MRFKPVLLLFFTWSSLSAQLKYVSPSGSDSNSGAPGHPWKTIQKAMDFAVPGDTIIILPGNYNETPVLQVNGTASNPIIFRGVSSDSVFIDGTGLGADNLLSIDSNQFVQVGGIHFMNNLHNNAVGVYIDRASHDITISNCKISNICFSANAADTANVNTNANPLLVYGNSAVAATHIAIAYNEIFDCRPGYSEGLTFDGNIDGFEIKGNVVHDIANIGIDMAGHYGVSPNANTDQARNGLCTQNTVYNCISAYATCAGIYADGPLNNVIERNIVYKCQYGIEIGCETPGTTASGIIARNNFIYNNTAAGIAFGGYNYPAGSGKITGCHLYNNTCWHNDTYYNGNGELAITYSENCTVENNIIYCNAQNRLMYCQPGNTVADTFNYNCWFTPSGGTAIIDYGGTTYNTLAAYTAATGQDSHSLFTDPSFLSTDTTAPDLHILNSSACLNAGNPGIGPGAGQYDIDGNPRFENGKIDIGAQQRSEPLTIHEADPTLKHIEIFPDPFHSTFTVKKDGLPGACAISIADVTCRLVAQNLQLNGFTTVINLYNLTPGIYFYSISDNTGNILDKGKIISQ